MRYFILLPFFLVSSIIFSQDSANICNNHVSGRVVNIETDEIITNAVVNIKDRNDVVTTLRTDNNGNFTIDLPCDNDRYILSSTVENFTKSTKLIFTSRTSVKKHNVTLDMYPIKEFVEVKKIKRIIVDSITFYPDDISINSEAALQLKIVSDLLNKYQNISLEIGFHSDSRGSKDFILSLTQERADACASYLINKGIESSRIIAKGYGDTKLLNECEKGIRCTEEKHLANRRSEFVVLQ